MATYVADVEIYPNWFLLRCKNLATGKVVFFEYVEGDETPLDVDRMNRFIKSNSIIGFNWIGFDAVIVAAAIAGYGLKALCKIRDEIIVEKRKYWEVARDYDFFVPRNHDIIDLIEVAPGQASLKLYGGRAGAKKLQDLPFDPYKKLTGDEIDISYDYCGNDNDTTELLYNKLKKQIDLRIKLGAEYGIDLRSKSDAQIAEAVIKAEVEKITGIKPEKPIIKPGTAYSYKIPPFIRFRHPSLVKVLDIIRDTKFVVSQKGSITLPEELADAMIAIGNQVYKMGIGGLHSTEASKAQTLADDEAMAEDDVTSYYPQIIINQKLQPSHLGWAFQKVFKKIVDRRVKAKGTVLDAETEIRDLNEVKKNANRPMELVDERITELESDAELFAIVADTLKIVVNGSFGKFGSKWSSLYSPDLLIQTTITGQLSLLMLIEWLEEVPTCEVVSANTDGVVYRYKKIYQKEIDEVFEDWCYETQFNTERNHYSALYSRDVNSYIAFRPDGKVKLKGAFAATGLAKNPNTAICVDAVLAYIKDGTPLRETIKACKDLTKFVVVRTVKGGGVYGTPAEKWERKRDPVCEGFREGAEYLGKVVRWYYSYDSKHNIHYANATEKGSHNLVPKSEGAMPCMELPDEFPDNIDYNWYVYNARKILIDIGYHEDLFTSARKKAGKGSRKTR